MPAETVLVDGAGDKFLTRSRFPANQDGGIGLGDPTDALVDLLHARTATYDSVHGRRRRLRIDDHTLVHQPGTFQGLGNRPEHLHRLEWLQLVVERPVLGSLDSRLGRALCGHHDHWHCRAKLADASQCLQAAHAGQANVENHQIHGLRG